MTILIFIAVLVVLILVHELGHFLAAKYFGIKVDEFGIGFPPKILKMFRWGETDFTLNAIPFGGFVKIFGENPDEESISGEESQRSFVNKPRWIQAIVLLAGVFFNFLLAWLLFSVGFMMGAPAIDNQFSDKYFEPETVLIIGVMKNSPADDSGLVSRDQIVQVAFEDKILIAPSTTEFTEFIDLYVDQEIKLSVLRDGQISDFVVVPTQGIFGDSVGIGIEFRTTGSVTFPFFVAVSEGFIFSVELTKMIVVAFADFISQIVQREANMEQIAGPVGIVSMVGEAADLGIVHLLWFTAIISLHLTIINLLPFPALDGGRLLFVAIESMIRRPINPKITNALNAIGFILLILLMILVTINDIGNIIS